MADPTRLPAETREGSGTGKARAVRNAGKVPAIIYGGSTGPESVALPVRELEKAVNSGRFTSTIFMLEFGGRQERVIPRAVQFHPVSDRPVHVDFMRLEPGAKVALPIPVHFKNQDKSPGLKRGGVLNVVRHEVELLCPADTIPQFIEGDLDTLEINDSLHISAFKLPEGVTPVIRDRDFTVATIAPPSGFGDAGPAAAEGGAAAPAAKAAPAGKAAPKAAAPAAKAAAPAKKK